uniref:Uncharacterized protein n=1 Tax=Cajanus cajan TaxID=3821 RepID=A0A151S4V2_CAJCA|nr:hypothetical protein KK1_028349 [Cajanus cajan]
MRRVLNNQPSDTQSQRENIFHKRCNFSNKACSLIVDSGSWCNCCSTRMVEKLGLTTTPHPKPYQLHWLNDDGDMVVNKQVEVEFSIGNYQDKVKCDVVPSLEIVQEEKLETKTLQKKHLSYLNHHPISSCVEEHSHALPQNLWKILYLLKSKIF